MRKPMVNAEIFGAATYRLPKRVFPPHIREAYLAEVSAALKHPGLHVFFFSTPWPQNAPMRHDLGGEGTESSPGIRWFTELVKQGQQK